MNPNNRHYHGYGGFYDTQPGMTAYGDNFAESCKKSLNKLCKWVKTEKTWLRCLQTVKCWRISTMWASHATEHCRSTACSISSNILLSNTSMNRPKYSWSSFGSQSSGFSQRTSKWAIVCGWRTEAILSCSKAASKCSASSSVWTCRSDEMTSTNLRARLQWMLSIRLVICRVMQKLVLAGSCDCTMPHRTSQSVTTAFTC